MIGLWMRVFWKKASKNQDFCAHWKYDFPEIFWFFQKISKFIRLQMPNNLKYSHVSMERKCPYLSFGTNWLFVWTLVWSQQGSEKRPTLEHAENQISLHFLSTLLFDPLDSLACRIPDLTNYPSWTVNSSSNSRLVSKFNNRKLSIFVWKHLPNIMN